MTKVILHTNGTGLWSGEQKAVRIVNIHLETGYCYGDEDDIFGELRVYFDTKTWNLDKDGLIYTDHLFIKELREFLNLHGLPGKAVDYSEQGMQGDDYVSLDADEGFYLAWMKKFDIPLEKLVTTLD